MKRARLFILGMGFAFVVPTAVLAETAFTTRTVNMRAGPSTGYELVMQLPGGTPVEVGGCVEDWSWCDVFVGPDRGWVYAGNLEYPYGGHRVVIMTYGPRIGLPIAPFVVGTYWDTYYRGRPWYGRRSYWVGHPGPSHVVVVAPGVHPGAVHHPAAVHPVHATTVHAAPAPHTAPHPAAHSAPHPAPAAKPASHPPEHKGEPKKH